VERFVREAGEVFGRFLAVDIGEAIEERCANESVLPSIARVP